MTKDKEWRINEIWIEVEQGEKDFNLYFYGPTNERRLNVRGDVYSFQNIYSYRNYSQGTIRIKLTNARRLFHEPTKKRISDNPKSV